MNLFAEIKTLVADSLATMAGEGALPPGLDTRNVTVEPPRDAAHGDMATNAAMVLAKPAKMKPRDLAAPLAEQLSADPRIAEATVAGPGFINLRLSAKLWQSVVWAALDKGPDFGRSEIGAGQKVNVEYVSANPTGPLHVGHTRGAVFGDALARLLSFTGHDVTKEYYVNDGGAQVDVLARSVYLRYREARGETVEIPSGLYPGDYLIPLGEALAEEFGDSLLGMAEEEWLPKVRDVATDRMMDMIRDDLAAIDVEMDVYSSERALYGTGRIEAALDRLQGQGLIYTGVLEPPKGKTPEDWEPRPQTLFKSSQFGDDVDRPIKKADGSWTYFAPDIAYHNDKIERGFTQIIDVFGADHGGYVKRMKAAVAALAGNKDVSCDIKLCQLVRLFKGGEPFKMSKRAGMFVTLRDVVDEVGPGVARFTMLTRRNDAPLDFDFEKALEQSKDNPVWYVQYASARTHSVFRAAAEQGVTVEEAALAEADLSLLSSEAELAVVRKLAEWPRLVELAASSHEPHRVAFYLYDLASELHALWNKGQDDPGLRIVQPKDTALTQARLAMMMAVRVVLSAGLGIVGVAPLTEMK